MTESDSGGSRLVGGVGGALQARGAVTSTEARRAESLKKATPAEVDKAAREFEGLFVRELMEEMWRSIPADKDENSPFGGGGQEESYYREMLSDAIAESVVQGKGIGIADVMRRDIGRLSGGGTEE